MTFKSRTPREEECIMPMRYITFNKGTQKSLPDDIKEQAKTDMDITKGVAIYLTKDEYVRFVSKLAPQLEEQIMQSIVRDEKVDEKIETCRDFVFEIRELFYDLEGSWGIIKDVKDIDVDKLDDILLKYSEKIGF